IDAHGFGAAGGSVGDRSPNPGEIERLEPVNPCGRVQLRHPRVHHHDAGREPGDEQETSGDAEPPMRVDEEAADLQADPLYRISCRALPDTTRIMIDECAARSSSAPCCWPRRRACGRKTGRSSAAPPARGTRASAACPSNGARLTTFARRRPYAAAVGRVASSRADACG